MDLTRIVHSIIELMKIEPESMVAFECLKSGNDACEDGFEEFLLPQATPTPVDDLNIHLHKEATTGGGLCAKLVFFVLLTVLSTLIGLIITEHRGLTDLDTINTESAFAHIFEGWIDKTPDDHEETYSVEHHEDEDDDVSHYNDHEEEEETSDEHETSKVDSDELLESEDEEDEQYLGSVDEETETQEDDEKVSETQEDDEKVSETQEDDEKMSETQEDDEKVSETQEDEEKVSETIEASSEKDETLETNEDESLTSTVGEDEPDEDEEDFREEVSKRLLEKNYEASLEAQESQGAMVVKFGVGAALLVVAHVVLIRKWRTARNSISESDTVEMKYIGTDLSRRDTLIPPPTLDEIGQDFEHGEEDYSEEEEVEEDDEEDDNENYAPLISNVAKTKYQELRSTYSHNLSPHWEPTRIDNNSDVEVEEEEEEDDDDEEGYDEDEEDEEVEQEEENDEISENEDEELLRRLEAKYGILRESVAHRDDPADEDGEEEDEDDEEDEEANSVYDFINITNVDDLKIREELDRAEDNLANATFALTLFNRILEMHPSSPRGFYGKSRSLDALAEKRKSNKLLEEAINAYQQVLKLKDVPDVLFQLAAERCINRMRFRGKVQNFYIMFFIGLLVGVYSQAVPVHKLLISRFPETVRFQNELAVTYLTTNNFYEAKKVLYELLSKWPNNGFAMVNYGFILKMYDLDLKQSVKYLKMGIETRDAGVIDGRFYYHLGDALIRLGRKDEAMAVHVDGVKNKLFLSKYQRSLHNVNRLSGKPWWKKEEIKNTQFFEKLEQNWKVIRDEGMSLLNTEGLFKMESEDLREVGDWKQFELYARGIKNVKNCEQCPRTCNLIESFPDAVGCKRGQIKFSVVQPGTHVWPHCGPTNCRLRSHLGLKVPANVFLRVADEIRYSRFPERCRLCD
ncbi:hypothetical protein FQR65_LT02996 [Abscondita terminalis]|nr:hypothetical protein FQR65_LT02996 [Abscondita terminalis]